MRVLVTGGAGYIGSHTVLSLVKAGHDVVAVDSYQNSSPESLRRVQQLAGKPFFVEQLDCCDKAALSDLFAKHPIDVVVHFAALKAVGESVRLPLHYYKNNLDSLTNLVAVMGEAGCFRLVFSSSATVYGNASTPPFSEAAPLEATSPYGRTKLFGEEFLRDIAHADARWRVALLRYFNPVGAHESGLIGESPAGIPNNLMPYVAQVALGAMPHLDIYGDDYATPDGTGVRDYIHVCDLAEGHVAAVEAIQRLAGCNAINLGSGRGYSVLEVVQAFAAAAGRQVPYRIAPRRPGDVAVSVADPSKARAILGWQTRLDLFAMCADTWRWQVTNPAGYRLATGRGAGH
jgi:UDP-glucose 4-epimerase